MRIIDVGSYVFPDTRFIFAKDIDLYTSAYAGPAVEIILSGDTTSSEANGTLGQRVTLTIAGATASEVQHKINGDPF